MANETIIPIPQAKYGINEIVYLKESAANGYLEALKIVAVRYDPNIGRTMYLFTFGKGKMKQQTVGDANDLRRENTIAIIEEELLTKCEALAIKVSFLTSQLASATAQLNACSPAATTDAPPSNPGANPTEGWKKFLGPLQNPTAG